MNDYDGDGRDVCGFVCCHGAGCQSVEMGYIVSVDYRGEIQHQFYLRPIRPATLHWGLIYSDTANTEQHYHTEL